MDILIYDDFVTSFQIIEPVIFAPLHVNANGRGYLDFTMSLELVTTHGDQEDVEHFGTWRPGTEQNVIMRTPNASSSQVIYKVVTVLVSNENKLNKGASLLHLNGF